MRPCVFRNILFLCIAVILLPPAAAVPVRAEGINVFDKNKNDDRRIPRKAVMDSDMMRRRFQSLRQEFDPETRIGGREMRPYFFLFIFMLCLISGLIYWRLHIRRRLEREISDPLFLVQELNNAHQISPQEKRLMLDLAADNALPNPLTLFVEPRFFLDAREKASYASSREIIESLLLRLFSIEVKS